jgi:hypothetical protein
VATIDDSDTVKDEACQRASAVMAAESNKTVSRETIVEGVTRALAEGLPKLTVEAVELNGGIVRVVVGATAWIAREIEKRRSREADEALRNSGEEGRLQLARENGAFAFPEGTVRIKEFK